MRASWPLCARFSSMRWGEAKGKPGGAPKHQTTTDLHFGLDQIVGCDDEDVRRTDGVVGAILLCVHIKPLARVEVILEDGEERHDNDGHEAHLTLEHDWDEGGGRLSRACGLDNGQVLLSGDERMNVRRLCRASEVTVAVRPDGHENLSELSRHARGERWHQRGQRGMRRFLREQLHRVADSGGEGPNVLLEAGQHQCGYPVHQVIDVDSRPRAERRLAGGCSTRTGSAHSRRQG